MAYSLDELQKMSSIVSNLSGAVIALVSIYASLSYRRWKREEIVRRRASIAQNCILNMEKFYSRMERLVESQDMMKSNDWGKSFYESYDQHFISAEIEADTLASKEISQDFKKIDALLKQLPLTRTSGSSKGEGTKESEWKNAAIETQDKIQEIWTSLTKNWNKLKEKLDKEALIKA